MDNIYTFAYEFRNDMGLQIILKEKGIPPEKVKGILYDGLADFAGYTGLQYYPRVSKYLTLQEWIDYFISHFILPKPAWYKRLWNMLKRVLKLK